MNYQDEFNYFHYPMSPIQHFPFDGINLEDFSSSSYPIEDFFNPQTTNCISLPFGEGIMSSTCKVELERPNKQLKTKNYASSSSQKSTQSKSTSPCSSPQIISFKNSGSNPVSASEDQFNSVYYRGGSKKSGTPDRCPMLAKEHVIAERKRREKLSERFIALSAVVPGLKKMDKVSVLGEAVKYLNHLQERVKSLEEQASRKTVDSAVLLKRSYVYVDDELLSRDDNSNNCTDRSLFPQVEARASGKDVLVRIHCEMNMGGVGKILRQVEKFGLNVISSSIMPFGNTILDLTIVAQMEANHCTSVKDLVRNLQQALLAPIR